MSQDGQIKINLTSPPLSSGSVMSVKVTEGVVAKWYLGEQTDGVEATNAGGNAGKDGQLVWTCNLASQRKAELSLAWEVSAPSQANVVGL